MNLLTYFLHLIFSSGTAYLSARNICSSRTRRQVLAEYQKGESGSVAYLKALSQRAAQENNPWLSEKLARHAVDEERHGKVFAQALKQVIDYEEKEHINHVNSSNLALTPAGTFYTAYLNGYPPQQLKPETIDWTVFIGSLYILELDASKEFVRMANILPVNDPLNMKLRTLIMSVAQDETRHAAYLYEALQQRMSEARVQQVIDEWRIRQINAAFTTAINVLFATQSPAPLEDNILYSWV